jgi:hypothetical protein
MINGLLDFPKQNHRNHTVQARSTQNQTASPDDRTSLVCDMPGAAGPLGAEWVWQNHVQQDYGKNPNGTGNDMVRDKMRDKVGHVPWNT